MAFAAQIILLRLLEPADFGALAFGLLVVGYLYLQGARSHTPYFLASTCFHRVFVVLPGMATLYALGARPQLCIGCGAVDATLVVLT